MVDEKSMNTLLKAEYEYEYILTSMCKSTGTFFL